MVVSWLKHIICVFIYYFKAGFLSFSPYCYSDFVCIFVPEGPAILFYDKRKGQGIDQYLYIIYFRLTKTQETTA